MSDAPRYTNEQKLEAIRRELQYRARVYPRLIATGKMPQMKADFQTKVFEEIAADYERAVKTGRLL